MKQPRFRALVLGTCLAFAAAADALNPDKAVTQYVLDQWNTEDGLPHNVVRAITQTRDGYLWLGTQAGLARFDGVDFTVFDHTTTPAIASDDIHDIFQDGRGDLWIATYGGSSPSRSETAGKPPRKSPALRRPRPISS